MYLSINHSRFRNSQCYSRDFSLFFQPQVPWFSNVQCTIAMLGVFSEDTSNFYRAFRRTLPHRFSGYPRAKPPNTLGKASPTTRALQLIEHNKKEAVKLRNKRGFPEVLFFYDPSKKRARAKSNHHSPNVACRGNKTREPLCFTSSHPLLTQERARDSPKWRERPKGLPDRVRYWLPSSKSTNFIKNWNK